MSLGIMTPEGNPLRKISLYAPEALMYRRVQALPIGRVCILTLRPMPVVLHKGAPLLYGRLLIGGAFFLFCLTPMLRPIKDRPE
jgi:hypothetical protein